MQYILCGFSGAGKSYSLEKLQESKRFVDYHFVDLDEFIESKLQMSIHKYVDINGEASFRTEESKYLREILSLHTNLWLSLGGGALSPNNFDFIQSLQSKELLYVKVDFEVCWERIKDDRERFLTKQGKSYMFELYRQREVVFNKVPVFDLKHYV